jgi:SAM-dependent methyltransferase
LDRTAISKDPLDDHALRTVTKFLLNVREQLPRNDYSAYLKLVCDGLSVLDIGVVEHNHSRMESPDWKHAVIRIAARRTVGIDVIPELVEELVAQGMDVRLCDATSDDDLGERFQVVHIGDVIEHVDSPVAMMKFAARHLELGGKVIVRTPNPFYFEHVHSVKRNGTDVSNLEHVCWVTPTHMLEIGRRSGLILSKYLTEYPSGFSHKGIRKFVGRLLSELKWRKRFWRGVNWRREFAELTTNPERYSRIYVYELTKSSEST